MPNSRPLRVFLCHAKEDKAIVRELYRQLTLEGWLDVWLDEQKLLPGQNWDIEIEKAVEESDIVIVCLSTQAVTKEGYVQSEQSFVLDIARTKPEETIFVIPLRLDECQVPRRLRVWQYLDYFPKSNRKWAYQRLLESLKLRATKLEISSGRIDPSTSLRADAQIEEDDLAKAERERKAKEERDSLAAQKAENERIAREKAERERKAKEERDQIARQNAEEQRKARAEVWRKINFKPFLAIGGIIIALLLLFFIGKYVFDSLRASLISVKTQISDKDGMVMVFVPAGEFAMGSDINSDEQPVHKVTLASYWIDRTEVTNKMYAKCVDAGTCQPPSNTNSYTRSSYYGNSEFDNYPIIYVDWNKAKTYCSWAGRRLPTEAEWEKAARGTDERIYPWGSDIPNADLLNYNSDVGDTTQVGKYPNGASSYGACDMAGNVWEWVSSLYKPYPYNASDGREDLRSSGSRVLRGVSWLGSYKHVHSSFRNSDDPWNFGYHYGFRCARGASQ